MARLLVLTAVDAERDAVRRGLGMGPADGGAEEAIGRGDLIVVTSGGIGPAGAAAAAAWLLARADEPFGIVVSAGIGGGFAGRAGPGTTVLGRRSVAAELGADSPEGFLPIERLGFGGSSTVDVDDVLLAALRERLPDAVVGEILTVSTVTGTAERADMLRSRYPGAVAEAMEGFGVGEAARRAGARFAELRTISNLVGPRDRSSWQLPQALAALERSAVALANLEA